MKATIESETKIIKSDSLVSLKEWHNLDTEKNQIYNHEYSVYNSLTNESYSYSGYYDGEHFKKHAENQYATQVKINNEMIEKVKLFLAHDPHLPR
jgi:hypothetical protein